MNRLIKIIFPPHAPVASVALVFLSIVLVAVVQILILFANGQGWLAVRAVAGEVIAIGGVPVALIILLHLDRRQLIAFAWPSAKVLTLTVTLTLGAVIVIDYLTALSEHLLPLPRWVEEAYAELMAARNTTELIEKVVILCAIPAICEEIFFRGFCLTSLAAHWGKRTAIVVTAFVFAVVHGNPWYLHLYFLLGLILGWVYAITGTLWAPVLSHFLNNLWTFANHVRGFEVPLQEAFWWGDAVFLASGALLLVAGITFLRSGVPANRR